MLLVNGGGVSDEDLRGLRQMLQSRKIDLRVDCSRLAQLAHSEPPNDHPIFVPDALLTLLYKIDVSCQLFMIFIISGA
jgi:hypothetical protein